MKLSAIGLGCVTFGREIDDAASFELMDAAADRGITLFDTAAAYAGGASERIVGQWLADRRPTAGALTIATKILPPYTPELIGPAVEQSRRRLGLESIPLLFLHRWDESATRPETLATLDRLIRSGQAGALGASNFSPEQLRRTLELQKAEGFAPFGAIQNNHNFAVREIDPAMRAICAEAGSAIIAYSPLGAGFLSGKHQTGVQSGSRFELIPGHQRIYFQPEALRRLEVLQKLAAQFGTTSAHLALVWALHQPAIGSVLVGGRSPAHLEQAFAALAAAPELVRTLLAA